MGIDLYRKQPTRTISWMDKMYQKKKAVDSVSLK